MSDVYHSIYEYSQVNTINLQYVVDSLLLIMTANTNCHMQ